MYLYKGMLWLIVVSEIFEIFHERNGRRAGFTNLAWKKHWIDMALYSTE